MCYFRNTTYTCSPQPRPDRSPHHTLRSSVLCSNPSPCPLPLWETRSTHWPFPCYNCTGETAFFQPPVHDDWNRQDQETHEEGARRYVSNLARFINAVVLASLPSTPQDFLSAYEVLALESSCRLHPGSFSCPCPSWGHRRWEYNLASDLRAQTAFTSIEAFVRIPAIRVVFSDMKRQTDALALKIAPLCSAFDPNEVAEDESGHSALKAHFHPVLNHMRRASPDHVFSKAESARRLEFAACARDAVVAAMDAALAPLAYNTAAPVKAGVDFRAHIVRTFSIFTITDPGLSPIRANMALLRLASLIPDPLFFPSDPAPEFDTTRKLLGVLMAHLSNDGSSDNLYMSLSSGLEEQVAKKREVHTRELENSLALHLSFHNATEPTEDRTNIPCEDTCTRGRRHVLRDANPQKFHVPRVRMKSCGHVMGQHCAFLWGAEHAEWSGDELVWVCPHPACRSAARSVSKTDMFGKRTFLRPADAAISGDMERTLLY